MSSFPIDKPRREKAIYFQIYNLKTKILHIFIKRRKSVRTADTTKAEKKAHNWNLQENKVFKCTVYVNLLINPNFVNIKCKLWIINSIFHSNSIDNDVKIFYLIQQKELDSFPNFSAH